MNVIGHASFPKRREAIVPSLEYHRIHRKLSVVVGGAALAADNLNAYVPGMGLAFDADVILPDDELLAWQQEYAGVLQDEKPPDILRVGCMRQSYNPLQQEIAPSIYNAMLARAVPPTDTFPYARLQAADAAYTKVFRGDPKDIVGFGSEYSATTDWPAYRCGIPADKLCARAASLSVKFINPGPATDTSATVSLRFSRMFAASCSAISRGFLPACLARRMATLVL